MFERFSKLFALIVIFILTCGSSLAASGSSSEKPEKGMVKWQNKSYHGKRTASGERHNHRDLVAAHPTLPFDTYLKVEDPSTGKMAVVRVNDRCPQRSDRLLVVSWGAARLLGILERGTAKMQISGAETFTGFASWYGKPFHGRKTANGEVYDMDAMTAAHMELPFNTRVRVVNVKTGKSVVVRINDRGPFIEGRIIDLSRRAGGKLGMFFTGTMKVRVEILPPLKKTRRLAKATKDGKR
ncbi:MAG: septal ring lytic transglycosylase RlpA family protein [Candidatus Poribacteria bacterium]|nr:septal ring lytic transglycosylase RlpA family protein [Candidatus Poribacteria bacterium]